MHCYFQRETEKHVDFPHVARVQERTAETCGVRIRTVQRIVNETKKSLDASGSVVLKSLAKA